MEELFPQIETLYRNVAYATDERYKQWHQQKRLCSGHHFDRYFTYAVIEGQISDVLFADLISTLASKSLEPVITHFEKNLVGLDVSDFILKLHFYDGAFSGEQAAQMARVLCRLGEKFYIKNDLIFSIAYQAVSLIKKYIALQSQFDREGLAVQLIELIEPVALALDFHDVLHEEGRRDDGTTPVLTSGQLSSIEQVLFKRLLTKVEQMALFTELEEGDLRRFFYALIRNGHDATELRERTSRLLDDSQTFGLKLLRIMSPTIHVSHLNQKVPTRNQIKTELSNDDYNLLWSLVSVDKLYHHTVRHYGKQHYIRKESSSYYELSEMELIGQFQQMHDEYINKIESAQLTD